MPLRLFVQCKPADYSPDLPSSSSGMALGKKRLINKPNSNKAYMGSAKIDWEITSGGVNSMPITKQLTKMYGRFSASDCTDTIPARTSRKVAIGISKAMPKEKNIFRQKSSTLDMSGMMLIPSGPAPVKNPNTKGKTIK